MTKPASLAGLIGFVAGVPADIAALPISYTVYSAQKDGDEERVDPLSTLLFPSFFLWRTSVLAIGTPLDILEFVFYRAWKSPTEKTQSDRDREETRTERQKGAACNIGTGPRFSWQARDACRLHASWSS
ncbi:MAG: hypothetical protein ACE5F1_02130 [Planctomycetota bacterium]